MLFKQCFLDGLADGTVTLAVRRWRRPTVRAGGRLRTAAGVLAIETVEVVAIADITQRDVRRAAFPSRAALLDSLAGDGRVYRIAFHFAGPDPRAALRRQGRLTTAERTEVERRLARLDRARRHGAWTARVLRLIADRPGVRAAELAAAMRRDTASLKLDVRKLKELGLTESLEVGYRLSPRGRAVLARWARASR